jgi:electron transport complex protein RnfG
MKKDFLAPILVLTLICLITTTALAFTNSVTEPKIEADKLERANAMRTEIIPQAEDFEALSLDGMPESVLEAYSTTNDVGYIFTVLTSGYGGDMKIICGLSQEGAIISCKTMEHSETKGIGTRVTDDGGFIEALAGKSSLEGVSAVSGATISSNAYMSAIADVFAAFSVL